jgi:hypothetical protein
MLYVEMRKGEDSAVFTDSDRTKTMINGREQCTARSKNFFMTICYSGAIMFFGYLRATSMILPSIFISMGECFFTYSAIMFLR